MWGSAVLDLGIGLMFLYLLLSLVCSVTQELIANVTSWRGRHLRASIQAMLDDPDMRGLARHFYANPRVKGLSLPGKLPSYIPPATFAKALVDVLIEDGKLTAKAGDQEGPLAPFLRDAAGDAEKLRADLEHWFDAAMDRFGGWYKRNVQLVIFAMALALAALLNASTLEVARQLWTQPILRAAIVEKAASYRNGSPAAPGQPDVDVALKQLDSDLPIGWTGPQMQRLFGDTPVPANKRLTSWLIAIMGWLLTAFATSLGAQFWFDTLGKALRVRAAGEKPQ